MKVIYNPITKKHEINFEGTSVNVSDIKCSIAELFNPNVVGVVRNAKFYANGEWVPECNKEVKVGFAAIADLIQSRWEVIDL